MSSSEKIRLPVQAVMSRQPDGTYKIAEAERVTVEADIIARWLLAAFDVIERAELCGHLGVAQ